jgi:hypothetical protein
MAAMRMVQVAGDAIIHVVSVRHRLVAAAGAVCMSCLMPTAAMINGAAVGVLARHFDHVLVDMTFVGVMEVTVVQIIYVVAVADGGMSAAWSMLVCMVVMGLGGAIRHGSNPFRVRDPRTMRCGTPPRGR